MTVHAACYLVLLVHLWNIGLARRYKFLSSYLVVEAVATGGLAWIPFTSWTYTDAYFVFTPMLWVLAYLVVLELCWLILEDYPGIAAAGRKLVNWIFSAAVLIASCFAAYGLVAHQGDFPILRSFAIVHFAVRGSVLGFLLAILYFVFRLRLELPRNRKIYSIGFAFCWALVLGSDALSDIFGYKFELYSNYVDMSLCSILLIVGACIIRPEGELRRATARPGSDARAAELQKRLRHLNQFLSGVEKKISR